MSSNLPSQPSTLQRICSAYENSLFLPFFVPLLNSFGLGTVDRLFSKHATDYEFKKLYALLKEFERRLDRSVKQPGSDDFFAAARISTEGVLQSQSHEKIKLFATVLADTWGNESSNWNEVSQTLKLIRELEDIHIHILREARSLSLSDPDATFNLGGTGYSTSISIDDKFQDIDEMLLTSCISDLISKGLVNDSFTENSIPQFGDIPTLGGRPKPAKLAYSISPLGLWFLEKVQSPEYSDAS